VTKFFCCTVTEHAAIKVLIELCNLTELLQASNTGNAITLTVPLFMGCVASGLTSCELFLRFLGFYAPLEEGLSQL